MTRNKCSDNSKNSEDLIEKITLLEKEIEYLKEINLRYSMIIRRYKLLNTEENNN